MDILPPEVLEAALAEMEQATEAVTTPSEPDAVEDVLKVTPRHDIFFRDYRDPHSLRLRGVSFPWEMPNTATVDYHRGASGWMVFLEADVRAVVVRIRHQDPEYETSRTLMGRTHSIFAIRDPGHYGTLMQTITVAIDKGESPLWALAMSELLPAYIRVALNEPISDERSNVFLTPFGFELAGADLARVFEKMKISTSIYGGRP